MGLWECDINTKARVRSFWVTLPTREIALRSYWALLTPFRRMHATHDLKELPLQLIVKEFKALCTSTENSEILLQCEQAWIHLGTGPELLVKQ